MKGRKETAWPGKGNRPSIYNVYAAEVIETYLSYESCKFASFDSASVVTLLLWSRQFFKDELSVSNFWTASVALKNIKTSIEWKK